MKEKLELQCVSLSRSRDAYSRGFLPGVLVFDVLDSATTLDTTDSKTSRVRKAANHPGLPLERALQGFVEFGRVLEINNIDVSIGGADNAEIIADVHRINSLLALYGCRRSLLSKIPVLDRLIPRARNHHGVTIVQEESTCSHWLVVCADNDVLLGGKIADLDVLVGAGRGDFCSILETQLVAIPFRSIIISSYLGEVAVQHRLAVFVGVSALTLAIGGNLVNADFVIPTGNGEEVRSVWRRGEGKVGDGIGRGVGERDVLLEIANSVACRRCGRGTAKKGRHGCGVLKERS